MNIIVSACLLGLCTRYDGSHNLSAPVLELSKKHNLIPVCPEQLGGLPTPRLPSEILGDDVINKEGQIVNPQFKKGADIAFKIAKICDCDIAILKQRSPSCGFGEIYDGSFSGTKVKGDGVFAKLLKNAGFAVYTEEDIKEIQNL
ncbi:MAG: DUF523 domain-containing protein [Eubacteriales bacterium]|nr:DUF523 domain-containing protein [Eubacteriales bacterium]